LYPVLVRGKTTLLRDIVRQVSNGIKIIKFRGLNVGLVDERGEIASLYKGMPENEIGIKTDVMENVSKSIGMKMLVRSMAPKIIVADEIGNKEDVEAINFAMCSGCKGIYTAHGNCFDDLYLNPILKELINSHLVEVMIFLDEKEKGKSKEIYVLNKKLLQYEKLDNENINKKIIGE
jgi:stage III sporulation protein AA